MTGRRTSAELALKSLSRSSSRHASTSAAAAAAAPGAEPTPYLHNLLQRTDRPSYLLSHSFSQPPHRLAYLAIRSFNAELATIPESVSNDLLGKIRFGWWRDSIRALYASIEHGQAVPVSARGQPVLQALHAVLCDPALRETPTQGLLHSEHHFQALISAREDDLLSASSSHTPPTLEQMERYAERTASRLAYLELDLLGIRDPAMDEVCSHIGKARGLTTALASIPFHAHMMIPTTTTPALTSRARRLILPQEYLLAHRVVEEEVYRKGSHAEGLKDAVFDTATRANDYLISARSALRRAFGHDSSTQTTTARKRRKPPKLLDPVLMGAIPAKVFLEALERVQFDPFHPTLIQEPTGWRLTWALWKASWRGAAKTF
ncbi:hypothetical protein OC846_004184 [Tilletia horrida]|uniref:Squalene/phytoene synthase n=1 Tax=Tilletia horrida TaxID=155126 RepID=A0AAN6JT37_9BASI|nr:hypothetical protein OC846_004184 [Tilletia horrida]KAK0564517.1 hypothetical protein OC861_004263 [Tilletia horrida]